MKLVDIQLPLAVALGWEPLCVRAWVLHDIAPHLADIATFAVHRMGTGWKVSNVETGGGIDNTWSISRAASIEYARQKLARQKRSFVLARIAGFNLTAI